MPNVVELRNTIAENLLQKINIVSKISDKSILKRPSNLDGLFLLLNFKTIPIKNFRIDLNK